MPMTAEEIAGLAVLGAVVVAVGTAAGMALYDAAWSLIDAVRESWRRLPRTTVEDAAPAGDGPLPGVVDAASPEPDAYYLEDLADDDEVDADVDEHGFAAERTTTATGGWMPPTREQRERIATARWWTRGQTIHLAECRHAEGADPLHFVLTLEEAQDWARLAELHECGHCCALAEPKAAGRHARPPVHAENST